MKQIKMYGDLVNVLLWSAILIFSLITLLSCNKESDGYHRFKVPAGQNNCRTLDRAPLIPQGKHSLQFSFETDRGWLMTLIR